MKPVFNFTLICGCLVGGIGLVIVGGLTGNEAVLAAGTGLLGVSIGAVGLDKPQTL